MATPEKPETKTTEDETTAEVAKETTQTTDVEEPATEAKADDAEAVDSEAKDAADQTDSLESIKKDLDAQVALLKESEERYKRLQADFVNFRRRNDKERQELSSVIVQGLIKDLLPIIDNFERALAVEGAEGSPLHDGILMVYKQLMASLEKNGLEQIKAVGEKFDPNFHQAVMRVQDADKEDDTIEEELQKGYIVQGRVIRPSMVKVVAN